MSKEDYIKSKDFVKKILSYDKEMFRDLGISTENIKSSTNNEPITEMSSQDLLKLDRAKIRRYNSKKKKIKQLYIDSINRSRELSSKINRRLNPISQDNSHRKAASTSVRSMRRRRKYRMTKLTKNDLSSHSSYIGNLFRMESTRYSWMDSSGNVNGKQGNQGSRGPGRSGLSQIDPFRMTMVSGFGQLPKDPEETPLGRKKRKNWFFSKRAPQKTVQQRKDMLLAFLNKSRIK